MHKKYKHTLAYTKLLHFSIRISFQQVPPRLYQLCWSPNMRLFLLGSPICPHLDFRCAVDGRSVQLCVPCFQRLGHAYTPSGPRRRRPAPAEAHEERMSPTWTCCPRRAHTHPPDPGPRTGSCIPHRTRTSTSCWEWLLERPSQPASRWSSAAQTNHLSFVDTMACDAWRSKRSLHHTKRPRGAGLSIYNHHDMRTLRNAVTYISNSSGENWFSGSLEVERNSLSYLFIKQI